MQQQLESPLSDSGWTADALERAITSFVLSVCLEIAKQATQKVNKALRGLLLISGSKMVKNGLQRSSVASKGHLQPRNFLLLQARMEYKSSLNSEWKGRRQRRRIREERETKGFPRLGSCPEYNEILPLPSSSFSFTPPTTCENRRRGEWTLSRAEEREKEVPEKIHFKGFSSKDC